MASAVPQDTPIRRASIADLSIEQIEQLVESMRERRMRSQKAFELAQEAKKLMKLEKDKARYDKLLVMYQKKADSVDKGLDVMSKYLTELKVLELVLGD